MSGITINNIQYIVIMDDNHKLKSTSLSRNVYYTLRDIFWNANDSRIMDLANEFIIKLDSEPNALEHKIYVSQLCNFLRKLKHTDFSFDKQMKEEDDIYLEFDIWNKDLQILIAELELLL
jgi:hypothetical protein